MYESLAGCPLSKIVVHVIFIIYAIFVDLAECFVNDAESVLDIVECMAEVSVGVVGNDATVGVVLPKTLVVVVIPLDVHLFM